MNTIFMSYDPFAMESRVCISKNGIQQQVAVCSTLEELTKELVDLAYTNDVYDMKFQAPSFIIDELKSQIYSYEARNYSTNKITIEGIR